MELIGKANTIKSVKFLSDKMDIPNLLDLKNLNDKFRGSFNEIILLVVLDIKAKLLGAANSLSTSHELKVDISQYLSMKPLEMSSDLIYDKLISVFSEKGYDIKKNDVYLEILIDFTSSS
jgi:hypothetical protein